jgi:hypothetical protein
MVFNDPLEHQKVSDEFVRQAVINGVVSDESPLSLLEIAEHCKHLRNSETLTGSFDEMPVGKRWHLIRVTCSATAG